MSILDLFQKKKSCSTDLVKSSSLGRLSVLTDRLEAAEHELAIKASALNDILNSLTVAVWAKDCNNRFVYMNNACKKMYTGTEDLETAGLLDTELLYHRFADVCTKSDEITQEMHTTCRFVEHCVLSDLNIWIDVIKSPYFKEGVFDGTVGSGENITSKIPIDIRDRYFKPAAINVPLDWNYDMEILRAQLQQQ